MCHYGSFYLDITMFNIWADLLCVVIFTGILIRIFIKLTTNWCHSSTCLVGKTAIVTGANTGIGYQTALDFAKRGARVILACRDKSRGEDARVRIIEETGNNEIVVQLIQLESFRSVRHFVKNIYDSEKQIDILVNNAAVLTENRQSEDEHQFAMQVNYFSPFLLTILLLDLLNKSRKSRVINVSSKTAKWAKNFQIDHVDNYSGFISAYFYSKLCNILFTIELARKLSRTNITTYSVHPGSVNSEIGRFMTGFLKYFHRIIEFVFYQSTEVGAQTSIYCAVAKGLEHYNGGHFENCKKVPTYSTANVAGLSRQLWDATIDIVELRPEEIHI